MSLHPTLQYCLSRQEAMVDLLRVFTNIETPSGHRESLIQFGQAVAEAFEKAGGRVRRVSDTDYGPVLRIEAGEGPHQVLFLAHMDTVHPKGAIQDFPFQIRGDEAYGPGVIDMKSGIVQTVFAFEALNANPDAWPIRLVVLCTPDEEIGSPFSRPLIETEGRRSLCALVPEPAAGCDGFLKTSRNGVGIFRLTAKGRPSHAGLNPLEGASAIRELAYQIGRIYEMARPEEGLFLNVGVIHGGTRINVVAAEAEAEVDVRLMTRDQSDWITSLLGHLTPQDGRVCLSLEGGLNRPPMERTPATEKLLRWAQEAAMNLGFAIGETHVGGGSDGNFTAAIGVPTLDGLGAVGAGAHAFGEERVIISSMPQRTALLVELIHTIAADLKQGG